MKIIVGLLVLMLLVVATFAYITLKDITGDPLKVFGLGREDNINFLILGLDTDGAREAQNRGWRSDTMVIASVDPLKNKITCITLPRDTRTEVSRLDNNGNVTSTSLDKINHAFAYGHGRQKYSYQNSMNAVNNFMEVDGTKMPEITHYVGIDMDGFVKLADMVGGVDLTLTDTMKGIGEKGQTVHLEGKKAEDFVRMRYGVTGGGDIGRGKRQQLFIRAFAKKLKDNDPIVNVPKIYKEASDKKYVDTNLNDDQVAALAVAISKIPNDEIEFVDIPGHNEKIKSLSFWIPDRDKLKQIIYDVFIDNTIDTITSAEQ